MSRQARAIATRGKIIDAAVVLFDEVGYTSIGLGDIIERADITKGALYYHFDSKEALAEAIIEEATHRVMAAFDDVTASSTPTLENMIHGSFVVLSLVAKDRVARIGRQLARALGQYSDAGAGTYQQWAQVVVTQARKAKEEGDLRPNLDADTVGETIVAVLLGAEQLSSAITKGQDMMTRLIWAWDVLLPGIVEDESLPYFREFLARESVRHTQPELSFD